MSSPEIIHAYRSLYRQGLQAIRYSTPARHVLLQTLRRSFRSQHEHFDARQIANTLVFLRRASEVAGMEHRILRNVLMTRYWEQPQLNVARR